MADLENTAEKACNYKALPLECFTGSDVFHRAIHNRAGVVSNVGPRIFVDDGFELFRAGACHFFVPLLSIPPLLIGGALLGHMLRRGFGGWLTALCCGAFVSTLYATLLLHLIAGGIQTTTIASWSFIAFVGCLYAGCVWLILRMKIAGAFTDE